MEVHTVVRDAIWRAVVGLDDAMLHAPNPAGWSILHVLEHLHIAERNSTAAIAEMLQANTVGDLPPADLSVEIDRTHKLQAPERSQPKGTFRSLPEARAALDASRVALHWTIATAQPGDLDTHARHHALVGMATARDWYDLVALHEWRHLAQIQDLVLTRR